MGLFILIAILFIVNASYVSYPDEFVNILGGVYINQGKIPYKEFFDHHNALPWYLSSLILTVSSHSFIFFRLIWAGLGFIALLLLGLWIRRTSRSLYRYYLIFFFLYPLVTVYFWLHLYLADSLATLFFSLTLWILLTITVEKKLDGKAMIVSSLLTFALIGSSMTFLYAGLILYLWQLLLLLVHRIKWKQWLIYISISAAPYIIYLLYLLITNSLADWYFANIVYNTKLYIDIPNYVRGRFFNPLKFGLTLIYNFWNQYLPTLSTIRDFNLYLPIRSLVLFSSLVLLILLIRKFFPFGILFFLLLSFSAPRSILADFKEANYQLGVLIMLGVSSSLIALYLLDKLESSRILINDFKRLTQVLIVIYLLFTSLYLAKNTYDKWYLRYTQKMPSIRDSGDVASFLDEILDKGDYYWIGPFETNEMFFVKNGQLPGKYISLDPQYKDDELVKTTFLKELELHPPKVIIFKSDVGIFGTPAALFGDFFLKWLDNKYTLIQNVKETKIIKSPTSLKLASHVYLINNQKALLLERLKLKGYIQ